MSDSIGNIYKPEVTEDVPFPQEGTVDFGTSQPSSASDSGKSYSPTETKDQLPPTKRIATELISQAMNTKSRKIIKEFQFISSGAIQIGDYRDGISGDIRVSRDGIVARNKFGVETVAIDGETGDAIFAGQLQTGSIVAGIVLLGDGDIQLNGIDKRFVFYDENTGLPTIVIGKRGSD